jgi:hypothetical protein
MFEVELVVVPLYAYDVLAEEEDVFDKLVVLELDWPLTVELDFAELEELA